MSKKTTQPPSKPYEVGYRRPPKHSRYKKGQSGNPTGKNKQRATSNADLRLLLERELNANMREGEPEKIVTNAAAGIEQLVAQFAAGDRHARRDVIALAEKLGIDLTAGQTGAIEKVVAAALAAEDEAIITDFLRRHGVEPQETATDSRSIKPHRIPEIKGELAMTMLATTANLRLVDALCRSDFVSFTQKAFHILLPNTVLQMNYHVWSIAYHLELVRRGAIKRLIISLPPRSLKSLLASVAFPAYVLGHDPSQRLIVISYSSDLATKLSNDFRMIIDRLWYQRLFPLMQTSGAKNTEFEVATTRNGYRLATSIDGPLTGRGGNILIVDEPLKPSEALTSRREWVNNWFYNTLVSRLDDMTTGAIIVVMQRLHDDDLIGALLRSPEHWVHLKLPAIAEVEQRIPIGPGGYHLRRVGDILHPERMPRSELEARRSLDPETFAAHYQQAPMLPGGNIIKREWIRYYDVLPTRNSSSIVLQSWDPASKVGGSNDWSVCTTWLLQDGNYYSCMFCVSGSTIHLCGPAL